MDLSEIEFESDVWFSGYAVAYYDNFRGRFQWYLPAENLFNYKAYRDFVRGTIDLRNVVQIETFVYGAEDLTDEDYSSKPTIF